MKNVLLTSQDKEKYTEDVNRRPDESTTQSTDQRPGYSPKTEYGGFTPYVKYDPTEENNEITNSVNNHKLSVLPWLSIVYIFGYPPIVSTRQKSRTFGRQNKRAVEKVKYQ